MSTLTRPRVSRSRVSMHQGQALRRIAQTYGSLEDMLLEVIQNAIDSEAENIHLTVNLKKRSIAVQDDGLGASQEKFEQSLASVCRTQKKMDKLGRFGIGLISPLGKCERFVFTSCPKSDGIYIEWEFVSDDIINQEDDITVPNKVRRDLRFARSGTGNGVFWRTEMRIEKFRKDLRVERHLEQDRITRAIQDRFSQAMKCRNTTIHAVIINDNGERIHWDIKAQEYRGVPIKEERSVDRRHGETTFKLFLSPRKGRKFEGRGIGVGERNNDFRINFETFVDITAREHLNSDVVTAFKSGIFEGEIINSGITLRPDRLSFEQNEAMVSFCDHINRWFDEIGRDHLVEAENQTREERYQRNGIASLRVLNRVFEMNPIFREIIESFQRGTIGRHHSDDVKKVGVQPERSQSIQGVSTPTQSENGGGSGSSGTNHETLEKHLPLTAQGPKGTRRTIVRDDSVGLQFRYEGLEMSNRLFDLDTRQGILTFNVRHPLWAKAEVGGDRGLMQFQEMIAIFALTQETCPIEQRKTTEAFFTDLMGPMVDIHLVGDQERGTYTIYRGPKKALGKKGKKG